MPGPPKRFARSIGLALTGAAGIAAYGVGATVLPSVLVVVLLVLALLASVVGSCAGCWVLDHLMRWGVIPSDVGQECADVQRRYRAAPGAAVG